MVWPLQGKAMGFYKYILNLQTAVSYILAKYNPTQTEDGYHDRYDFYSSGLCSSLLCNFIFMSSGYCAKSKKASMT
jgi:hypothetical protein